MGETSLTRFKQCKSCGVSKPETSEYFGKHSDCKNGLTPRCKDCLSAARKAQYYRDVEKSRAQRKRYRLTAKTGGRMPVEVVCRECKTTFISAAHKLRHGRDKYCSLACSRAFNEVTIVEGIAYIRLTTKTREFVADTLVDAEDLDKIRAYGGRAFAERKRWGYRAYISGGDQRAYLHRVVMEADPSHEVDHRNHDTLDNRKTNLRRVTRQENNQNRSGANRNSASGIRNVSWDASRQCWEVSLCVNRQKIHVGRYKDLAEAERVAIQARRRYMTHASN